MIAPRSIRTAIAVGMLLGLGVWAGCSNDDDNGPPGGTNSTLFAGVFSNGTENGAMSVNLNTVTLAPKSPFPHGVSPRPAARAVVTATGILHPVGGSAVNLTGTYNDQTDTLTIAGGGYTFTGEHDTTGVYDTIGGGYTGPNGSGFFGLVTGVVGASTYCGSFASGTTTLAGTWNFLVAGGVVRGIGVPATGSPLGFSGTIQTTGTSRAISAGSSQPGVFTLTVNGTLNTNTGGVSGTWTYDDLVGTSDDSGTWTGTLCQ